MITIAALAVDPFSQQIIQSEPCLQNITGPAAEIPKLQNFTLATDYDAFVLPQTYPLAGPLQVAIYMGLLSPPPNSSAAMTANCRTGNCTFPSDDGATFSTLAMCHSCVDISHIITHDKPVNGDPAHWFTAFASTTDSPQFNNSLFSFEALMVRDPYNHTWNPDDFDNPDNYPSYNFAVACGMTPCLKTFGANVTNGVYQERELSSVSLVGPDNAGYTLATNKTLRNGTWQSCKPTAQNTTANTLRVNTTTMSVISRVQGTVEKVVISKVDLDFKPGATLWYPEDCVWWFRDDAMMQMWQFFFGLFDNKTLGFPFDAEGTEIASGDLWLVNLYRNGNASMDTVNAFMDGLTWSLTAAMRQTPNSDDTPRERRTVYGQTQVMQTCLTVRWVWLSLPASLLGLQLAFLVVIVVISGSAEHWRGDWKDSSLALLYHGLEGSANLPNEKVEREELHDKDGMFKMARKMKVQLRQGRDNWRFHTVS